MADDYDYGDDGFLDFDDDYQYVEDSYGIAVSHLYLCLGSLQPPVTQDAFVSA